MFLSSCILNGCLVYIQCHIFLKCYFYTYRKKFYFIISEKYTNIGPIKDLYKIILASYIENLQGLTFTAYSCRHSAQSLMILEPMFYFILFFSGASHLVCRSQVKRYLLARNFS